ncbi:DUF3040 domain-containing protein [Hamadaea sp. NPDC050747]|uniref:DUF3040 domain-containing protein n=1 Tax=Hamadaea sp. NPDC050747 TaxID=3155789 RepID=UPI00340F9D7E
MLTPQEQIDLADIERHLTAEDPGLARRLMAHRRGPGWRIPVLGVPAILLVVGLAYFAGLGIAMSALIVVVSAYWICAALRPPLEDPRGDSDVAGDR